MISVANNCKICNSSWSLFYVAQSSDGKSFYIASEKSDLCPAHSGHKLVAAEDDNGGAVLMMLTVVGDVASSVTRAVEKIVNEIENGSVDIDEEVSGKYPYQICECGRTFLANMSEVQVCPECAAGLYQGTKGLVHIDESENGIGVGLSLRFFEKIISFNLDNVSVEVITAPFIDGTAGYMHRLQPTIHH